MPCGRLIRLAGRRALLARQRIVESQARPLLSALAPGKSIPTALASAHAAMQRIQLAIAGELKGFAPSAGVAATPQLLEAATSTAKRLVNGYFVRTGRFPTFAELRAALAVGSSGGSGALRDSAAAAALLQATGKDTQQLVQGRGKHSGAIAPLNAPQPRTALEAPELCTPSPHRAAAAVSLPVTDRHMYSISAGEKLQQAGISQQVAAVQLESGSGPSPSTIEMSEVSAAARQVSASSVTPPHTIAHTPASTALVQTPTHLGRRKEAARVQPRYNSGTGELPEGQKNSGSATGVGGLFAQQLTYLAMLAVVLSASCAALVVGSQWRMEACLAAAEERLAAAEAAAQQWRAQLLALQEVLVADSVAKAMARWVIEHDKELHAASHDLLAELRAGR